ncbi:Phage-related baseplate assembly protein [Pseudobythopirellula maris]|uniref:Phage-related baseplate assembly protein n=1 Tax=Pseudobythopirellula maris TaxID=2527991 RepID=A0A5C5ZRA4_9BACT|nr:type VI secretion system tip protein TssI/VgrG [Pseudobythopirellula maris]TWT90082.1 Phage-related baseplate assembly protein [Pseudobythopirellula maris]
MPDNAQDEDEPSQDDRALRIDTPLDDESLLITRFSGGEGLCSLFRFELALVSERDDIDFSDLLGQSVTVTVDVPGSESRSWNGVVTRFSQHKQDEDFTYYDAVVEPKLALLGLQTGFRVFQDQKVDDVLDTLLDGLTVKKTFAHADDRQPHNYCVQYGESDLAFFSRLIEEAGLFYWFEHSDDDHTLVLCDDSSQCAKPEGMEDVVFRQLDGGVQDEVAVTSWTKTQQLTPTRFTCHDPHFQLPRKPLEGQRDLAESFTVGTVTHKPNPTGETWESFGYPGGYASRYDSVATAEQDPDPADFDESPIKNLADDAVAEARLRSEIATLVGLTIEARSDVLPLAAGHVFTLKGHFNADGDYLVTAVSHQVELGIGLTSAPSDDELHYENAFVCQPSDLVYRPVRRTPKPVISGVQSAWVVSDLTANEEDPKKLRELFCDKYGRVKVWFPWDRRADAPAEGEEPAAAEGDASEGGGADGDDSEQEETANVADRSCWVRVAQVWAGNGWGAFFWPRHGQEVLVAFEHGDPDRPVIVGSLYNAKNMPPMPMPLHADMNGVKSCTVNGNPAVDFGGLTFSDEPGNEHVEVRSKRHAVVRSKESQHQHVPGAAVRMSGSLLASLGSGAGGGVAKPKVSGIDGQHAALAKKWGKKLALTQFESDIKFNFGHTSTITGGMPLASVGNVVLGGNMRIVMDPLGWVDDDQAQQIQDYAFPMGQWSGVFGSSRSLHYGPSTTIRHGAEVTRRVRENFAESNTRTQYVGGIASASTALLLLGALNEGRDSKKLEVLMRLLGPRGLSGTLLNLLIEYEQGLGTQDAGIDKQGEASSLNDHADVLGDDYASLITAFAEAATDQGESLSSKGEEISSEQESAAASQDLSADDAESDSDDSGDDSDDDSDADSDASGDDSDAGVDASGDEDEPEDVDVDIEFGSDEEADVYECYDGLLMTGARNVSVRARPSDEADDDTDPSLIHLDSQGGGEDNGAVAITASGQTTIACGPAAFQIRRSGDVGQIDATTGDQGTITITTGGDSGSKAVLDPESINLSVGGDSGAVIAMTSDGIKLTVGSGGPCLEITTSGVTMSSGSNSVAVDTSGQTTSAMDITHTAQNGFTATGTASAELSAAGQTTVKGAMVMVN